VQAVFKNTLNQANELRRLAKNIISLKSWESKIRKLYKAV
jgi:hypothetical protein